MSRPLPRPRLRSPLAILALCGACKHEDAPPANTAEARSAVLAAVIRDQDDQPVVGAQSSIGYEATATDMVGMIRYQNQLAGRLVVRGELAGWSTAMGVGVLDQGATSGVRLTMAPLEIIEADPSSSVTLDGGDLTLTFPPGALSQPGGGTASGNAEFGWYQVGDSDPAGPGPRLWLQDDQYEEPFDVARMWWLAPATLDGVELDLATDGGQLHYDVGPDWPLDGRDNLGVYSFDQTHGYWSLVRTATVVDGAIDLPFSRWGWFAIGAMAGPTACVTGRVVDDKGDAAEGAEVTISEPGRLAVNRAITDSDGVFCAAALPRGQLELTVWGWNAVGKVLITGQTAIDSDDASDCPGPCKDLGQLPLEYHVDGDGDVFWDTQGDCDDGDLTINPIDSGDICIGG